MDSLIQRLPIIRKGDELPGEFQRWKIEDGHIVVWVSLLRLKSDRPPVEAKVFPAIVDTGYPGGFAITEELMAHAADVFRGFEKTGPVKSDKRGSYRIVKRKVWLYANKPGTYLLNADGRKGMMVEIDGGIKMYLTKSQQKFAGSEDPRPSLPLLGMHSILRNGLVLHPDGGRREASLSLSDTQSLSLWGWIKKAVLRKTEPD